MPRLSREEAKSAAFVRVSAGEIADHVLVATGSSSRDIMRSELEEACSIAQALLDELGKLLPPESA